MLSSHGNNRFASSSDLSRRKASLVGSVYLQSVVAPEVKGKVSKLYRIESIRDSENAPLWKLKRQRLKTLLFFVLDFAVLGVSIYTYIAKKEDWKLCRKRFDAWIITVICGGLLSLLLNFASWASLRKIRLHG